MFQTLILNFINYLIKFSIILKNKMKITVNEEIYNIFFLQYLIIFNFVLKIVIVRI